MTGLGLVAWPPAPITTERLVLRESEAGDREAFVELFSSPEVGTYVGGAEPRDEVERTMPEVPGRRTGFFVVALDGAMIGMITFDDAQLGYMFLPEAWGKGYAFEACAAALAWFAAALPGEQVVSDCQVANEASMRLLAKLGFTEEERYEAYGAEQCHWRQ
ncbi:GNAT family N-acetyltransferase [Lentzea flaviverrucosa]|uniref:Protein N-acetyltransferase, RimJ/RimL family n=1 Tax=Lentzea flaviverrucosa TaxID=200379 RepID=A0A1H9VML2_9PSEU|nr:GNAT family N-acetyltransferase [Lentzea flaviverrucosa]RDI23755.1 RimJ/RimL family protein N-acetyltransferase [Lentzea flaviverrucosa]SES22781.1 Protein N-acetyltransferase, RimJ/RimL family [Lentzea flaviverrucosa]